MRTDPGNDGKAVLEFCFVVLLAVAVVAAFIAALSYDFVSARAPLVVMIPLLLLIGIQFNRVRKRVLLHELASQLRLALKGDNDEFKSVIVFIGLMVLLLLLIYFAGHYVGIAAFMFVMLRWMSREKLLLALGISIGITALIFALFEYGFNIELYRGLLFRLLARAGLF